MVKTEKKSRKPQVKWDSDEDKQLTNLVNAHGTKNWRLISDYLPHRKGKQCRERWVNQVDPTINKGPWTNEEDLKLERLHIQYGNKWAELAKHFEGRPDNAIKNHWHSISRQNKRVAEVAAMEKGTAITVTPTKLLSKRKRNGRVEEETAAKEERPFTLTPTKLCANDFDINLGYSPTKEELKILSPAKSVRSPNLYLNCYCEDHEGGSARKRHRSGVLSDAEKDNEYYSALKFKSSQPITPLPVTSAVEEIEMVRKVKQALASSLPSSPCDYGFEEEMMFQCNSLSSFASGDSFSFNSPYKLGYGFDQIIWE